MVASGRVSPTKGPHMKLVTPGILPEVQVVQKPTYNAICPHCTAQLWVDDEDFSRIPGVRGFVLKYTCPYCHKVAEVQADLDLYMRVTK